MRRSAEGAVELDEAEALALLRRLIARHIADEPWLYWAEVPELSEASFDLVCAALEQWAKVMPTLCDIEDRVTGIDSRQLLEAAL